MNNPNDMIRVKQLIHETLNALKVVEGIDDPKRISTSMQIIATNAVMIAFIAGQLDNGIKKL